ncbi:MAG: hypothetical protein JNL13_06015 [Chitinophagaceae bacterium]|nr:hypothetical protein [Chitinophagaceae bacterium]
MRKSIVFIAALMVASLISCKKEEMKSGGSDAQADPVSRRSDTTRIDSVVYFDADGKKMSPDRIDERLDYCLLLEPLSGRIGKATYFTSTDAFYAFIKKDEAKYREVIAKMDFVRSIQDRAAEMGIDWESDKTPPESLTEYIESWRDGSYRTAKVTGAGLLYEHYVHPNPGGSTTPFFTFPRWTLGGFRNKASSAVVVGLNFLWDKTWFRGKTAVIFGFPYGVIPFVKPYGIDYNDRAESTF